MRENTPNLIVSRATLLELRLERSVMEEGYRFLDEKRSQLAHEILKRLKEYTRIEAEYVKQHVRARAALRYAVAVHGMAGLQVHPPGEILVTAQNPGMFSFLGTRLASQQPCHVKSESAPVKPAAWSSYSATECTAAFQVLVTKLVELATAGANLRRLGADFVRTQRRTRALENVLLPEIRASEKSVEETLEESELEEAIRVRWFGERRHMQRRDS